MLSALLCSCGTKKADANMGRPVDLGLSVLWADHNLGASNEKEIGIELCWNDSIKKKRNKSVSSPWGKGWKTPSQKEIEELIDKCTWKWRSSNPKGYIITGPNGNSIFMPFVASGYWTRDMDKNHKDFASFMYFNSSYPDMSYLEPENMNSIRPIMKATRRNKARAVANHKALADLLNDELADKDSITAVSHNFYASPEVYEVKEQSVWLPLHADSLLFKPYVWTFSSSTKDGYPIIKDAKNYVTIQARGVSVFSFRLQPLDCEKAEVIIYYKNGDKEDEVEEEIEATGDYDTPAIITNKSELTTIKLRIKSGTVIPTAIHFLNSYSKVTWE